eukprot:SAG31_NODE_3540_length_4144_cov_2.714957_6_plen_35_part_00
MVAIQEGASRVAPIGDYEAVRDARKWAGEEAAEI